MSGIIWRNLEKSPKCIFSANIGCYMTLRKQRLQCNFFLHFSLQACTEGFLRRRNFQMINEWCSVLAQLASQLLCMEMGLLRLATDLNKRSNWITCLKHVHSRILNSSFFFQDDEKDIKNVTEGLSTLHSMESFFIFCCCQVEVERQPFKSQK
jgi:hypothetical protein